MNPVAKDRGPDTNLGAGMAGRSMNKQQLRAELDRLALRVAELESREKELVSERDKLQALVDGLARTGIGVDIVGTDFRIQYQNQPLRDGFGDLVGKLCHEEYRGRDAPCEDCPMMRAMESKAIEAVELTAANGRDYQILSAPFPNPDGTIDKAIEVVLDITERRQAEQALQEREKLFRLITRNVTDIIFTMNMDLKMTYISPSVERIRGYTPEEVLAMPLDQQLTPACMEDALNEFRRAVEQRQRDPQRPPISYTAELELTCKDGSTVWTECTATGLFDDDGEALGFIGVARDITEQRRASKALRESEELYRTLVETSPDAITMTDLEGNFLMANLSAAKSHGCETVEEFLDSAPRAFDLLAPEDQAHAATNTMKTLQTGHSGTLEYTLIRKDGSRHPVEMSASLISDTDGNPRAFIGITRDITARQRDERELAQRYNELVRANKELERLQRSRDEFIAMVSHELRTPLVTGLGYLELALDGQLGQVDDQASTGLKVSLKNLRRLAALIDDVLNYHGLIRRGHRRSPVLAPVGIARLFQEVVSEFQVRSGRHSDAVHMVVPEHCPRVLADEDMIHRALNNLLNNAARHAGPDARITIAAEIDGEERVRISVRDDGTGIPESLRDRVFEPFVKSDASRSGSGLGLAILRTIVEAHESQVELESVEGQGTSVTFPLRVAPAESEAAVAVTARSEARRHPDGARTTGRVLVVEDDEDTLTFLEQALSGSGFDVSTALSAETAEDSLHERPIDLVLVDLCLPGMDGDELCRKIKNDPTTAELPVYIITARAEQESRNRAESAGCDGYLVKPVNVDDLIREIEAGLE